MITPPLLEAAAEVQVALADAGLRFCVIGGLAVQRWGEPRATQDVDLSVLAPIGDERRVLDVLLGEFGAARPDAREFALVSRVLLINASNGVGVDVALAGSPFEVEVLDRSSAWTIAPETLLRTCSAEDLLIYKLVAGRPRDVADVEGIVRRQGRRLDPARIRRYAALFAELKEEPELARPFEQAWARVAAE